MKGITTHVENLSRVQDDQEGVLRIKRLFVKNTVILNLFQDPYLFSRRNQEEMLKQVQHDK